MDTTGLKADAEKAHAAYLAEVTNAKRSCRLWQTNRGWTPIATNGLVAAGRTLFPAHLYPDLQVTAKGHKDKELQSEYMTLDVCIWDGAHPWNAPLFVAETESKGDAISVQYSAWKLLVAEARVRVLLAYYGEGYEHATSEELVDAVLDVCSAHRGRALVLFAASALAADTQGTIRRRHAAPRVLVR